jgi:sRNA-binding carbon storage regulator CsrA
MGLVLQFYPNDFVNIEHGINIPFEKIDFVIDKLLAAKAKGEDITVLPEKMVVKFVQQRGQAIRIGFEAPQSFHILRDGLKTYSQHNPPPTRGVAG